MAAFQKARTLDPQPLFDAAIGYTYAVSDDRAKAEQVLRDLNDSAKKDAMAGPAQVKYLAMIAAWVGDNDLACEQLASAVRLPSTISYGELALLPFWDPLRGDPRFEKIVADLAPKGALR